MLFLMKTEFWNGTYDIFFFFSLILSEDADQLRMHTLSEAGDVDSLEKMVDDGSDSEEAIEDPSEDPWFIFTISINNPV